MKKYLDLKVLEYLMRRVKEYTKIEIETSIIKQMNCPNCSAHISNSDKCEYCGTNYAAFMTLTLDLRGE